MSAEDIAVAILAGLNGPSKDTNSPDKTLSEDLSKKAVTKATEADPGINVQPTLKPTTKHGTGKSASNKHTIRKKRAPKVKHVFPVEPRTIQTISKPREYMNHSYRDFSSVPAEIGYEVPTKIEDMNFSQKVHNILSQDEYKKWISWLPHGRAFKVHVPTFFEQKVCPKYFGHKRYSSFLRQLSNHGFKHISRGQDRNAYYHEFMLRGMPHLTKYMPRAKDARRLLPDPENEPDFYQISQRFPLEDTKKALAGRNALGVTALPEVSLLGGQPRLASDVSWLASQLPPAKIPALSRAPPGLLPVNETRSPLDVAQSRAALLGQGNLSLAAQAASLLQAQAALGELAWMFGGNQTTRAPAPSNPAPTPEPKSVSDFLRLQKMRPHNQR